MNINEKVTPKMVKAILYFCIMKERIKKRVGFVLGFIEGIYRKTWKNRRKQ
jgi:hypothetical protein